MATIQPINLIDLWRDRPIDTKSFYGSIFKVINFRVREITDKPGDFNNLLAISELEKILVIVK
jgi:hypothetical protein